MANQTANQPTCHAMLVKKRGIPCRCIGKYFNQKDGNHYCGKHFDKTKNREFKLINTLTSSVPDCAICLEPINATDKTYKTVCMHTFHENCLNQFKKDGGGGSIARSVRDVFCGTGRTTRSPRSSNETAIITRGFECGAYRKRWT